MSAACLNCARLAEEVASLRQELNYEVDHQLSANIQGAVGCTPQQAAILALLYHANRRYVRAMVLVEAIGSSSEEVKVAHIQISKLRTRLPADAIEGIYGRGYRLTEAGRAVVDGIARKAAA